MRYRYYDIGQQCEDSSVVVRLHGSASNVILVDGPNLARYRSGEPFLYTGGHFRRSPVRLQIPGDGHWFVVIDQGGYKGRVRAEVEVLASGDLDPELAPETTPVEVAA